MASVVFSSNVTVEYATNHFINSAFRFETLDFIVDRQGTVTLMRPTAMQLVVATIMWTSNVSDSELGTWEEDHAIRGGREGPPGLEKSR